MMSKRNFSDWNPSLFTNLVGFACSRFRCVPLVSQSSRTCERDIDIELSPWDLAELPFPCLTSRFVHRRSYTTPAGREHFSNQLQSIR